MLKLLKYKHININLKNHLFISTKKLNLLLSNLQTIKN